MTKITLKFANQTQLFHFLENIANAQHANATQITSRWLATTIEKYDLPGSVILEA